MSDALSSIYLRLLVRFNPGDLALKHTLARNLRSSGNFQEARRILETMMQLPGKDGTEARLAILEVDRVEASSLASDAPRRNDLLSQMGGQLEGLRDVPFEPEILVRLGEIGLMAGHRNLAVHFLRKSVGEQAQGEAIRVRRAISALDLLLAHEAGPEALDLAETLIAGLGDNHALLERGVDIALGQSDHVRAQTWGRRLVALTPDDPETLLKQLDLELATSNVAAAVGLAEKLVELEPDNAARHALLARIAQWNGQSDLALANWEWLAYRDPDSEAMTTALDLAQALNAHEKWVKLAEHLVQTRALEPRELEILGYLHLTQRTPAQLAAFLEQYLRRYPEHREAWEVLADAYEKQGNFVAAANTWERMTPVFVRPVDSAVRQAELLKRGGRAEDAISTLRKVSARAKRDDSAYWRLYGDLAWEHSHEPEAFVAYRAVWEANGADAPVAERLIESYRQRGEFIRAVTIAREAYERRGEERWLLLAMDGAAQASLWSELKSLSDAAQREEHKFAKSEMYWLLQAHLATHERRKEDAQRAYDSALAVNPASTSARIGILWLDIELGDKDRLARHLEQWRRDAILSQPYWAPFAAGLVSLGRASESLPWFDKQARHRPDDLLWLMSYADALARAGQATQAWRVRNHVHAALRRRLDREHKGGEPDDKALLLTHAALVQEFEGAQAGEQVLRALLARGVDDAAVHEMAVASYLAKNEYESARRWLLRAHSERTKLPAWQSLALALAQDDKKAIAQLLDEQGDGLSPEDRITGMRRVGRDDEALVLAQRTVAEREGPAAEALQQHIDELTAQRAGAVIAQHDVRRLGELEIGRTQLTANVPLNDGRAGVQLSFNELRPKDDDLSDVGDEHDISLQYEHPVGDGRMRFSVGTNQRSDESVVYGRYEWTRPMWTDTTARLDVSLNGVTDESAALRAIGTRDKVAAGVSVNLTDTEFIRAELAGQRFRTRDGHTLGKGYRIDAEVGSTLLREGPLWQVRLQGSFQKNSVRDTLPEGLARSVLVPSTDVENVLADRYGTFGVGTTVRVGATQEFSRAPFGQLDAWLGRVWPDDKTAYHLRLGMGMSILSAGTLSADAFYTNVQGGHADEAYRGVGIFYTHRF